MDHMKLTELHVKSVMKDPLPGMVTPMFFVLSYERPYLVLALNLILFLFTQWEYPDKVKEKHLHL